MRSDHLQKEGQMNDSDAKRAPKRHRGPWKQFKAECKELRRKHRYIIRPDGTTPATWKQVTLEMFAAADPAGYRVCTCGTLFIAHHTARYCSSVCQANVRRPERVEI